MLAERITDTWWMIKSDTMEGSFAFFGYNEIEVKAKYFAWLRPQYVKALVNCR